MHEGTLGALGSARARNLRASLAAAMSVVLVAALGVGTSTATAADRTTITCFSSGTKEIAGVQVTLENAGAEQGTHLPCGYWFSPDYFEHFHPDRSGTVGTAWSFSPGLNSIIIRILYNADSRTEEYRIVAKDSGGNPVGSPIVYFNKDEAERRIDFPTTVTRLEVFHKGPPGTLALFNFSVPSNDLDVNLNGDGNVKSDVGGIDCGGAEAADCQAAFADLDPSTVVTLTATPDAGQVFNGWTGCDSTSGSTCTVTMDKAKEVTASFSGPSYGYLAVDVQGEGKVVSTPAAIDFGLGGTDREGEFVIPALVTLNATPKAGWRFVRWEGDRCSGSNPTCVVTVDDCLATSAVFGKIDPKVSAASTRPKQTKGTKSINVGFSSTDDGPARVTLLGCSGSRCSKRLLSYVTRSTKGSNRITVSTPALSPGRYRIVVSNATSSSAVGFTVAAPAAKPRPRFTG